MLEARVRDEIVDLHRFFVAWFTAAVPRSAGQLESRFAARMGDGFSLIAPSGERLDREAVLAWIEAAYGSRPDIHIAIRNVGLRPFSGERLLVATYEEWQRGHEADPGRRDVRISTVVMRPEGPGAPDGRLRTPNGFVWLHVHETMLPERVAAESRIEF